MRSFMGIIGSSARIVAPKSVRLFDMHVINLYCTFLKSPYSLLLIAKVKLSPMHWNSAASFAKQCQSQRLRNARHSVRKTFLLSSENDREGLGIALRFSEEVSKSVVCEIVFIALHNTNNLIIQLTENIR